jgi:hypothetical protein
MTNASPQAWGQEFENWRDAIADGLSGTAGKALSSLPLPSTSVPGLTARLLVWQFESRPYGLKHLAAVRRDENLMQACERVIALCRQEIAGEENLSSQYERLRAEIGGTWAIEGERERVRRMQFARAWAWAGARKWAWVGPKTWNNAWTWALTATRTRNYAQAVALTRLWSEVWTVLRQRVGKKRRMRALRAYFLELIQNYES